MAQLNLGSPEATRAAGEALGRLVQPGDVIGLVGDLGAGKTALVQGLAAGLGVPPALRVTSPTFTLVNQYRGGRTLLVHADLYRIGVAGELDEIGLEELIGADCVVAIEWSDRFDVLPKDALVVTMAVGAQDERIATIAGSGPRSAELGRAWVAACSEASVA